MKKKSKILFILLFITACIFSAVSLYLAYLNFPKKQPYVVKPFQFNTINLQEYSSSKLNFKKNLEILPNNFSEVIEKNNLNISNKNIVELLRYGQTIVDLEKETQIEQIVQNLSILKTPLIVDDSLISIYFQSQLKLARKEFIENEISNKLPQAIEILKTRNLVLSKITLVKEENLKKINTALSQCRDESIQENFTNCFESLFEIENRSFVFLNSNQKEYFERIKNIYSILNNHEFELENDLSENLEISNNSFLFDYSNVDIKYNIRIELLSEFTQFASYLDEGFLGIGYQNKTISSLKNNLQAIQTSTPNEGSEILSNVYSFPLEKIDVKYSKLLLSIINESGVDKVGITPFIEKPSIIPSINDNNISEEYDIPPIPFVVGKYRIPILMYHHIGTTQNISHQGLYVSPEIFEKQVAYLVKKNYKIIDTAELSSILLSGTAPVQKTIMITFDDSSPTHYSAAFPILKKYKQKGVFFVVASRSFLSHAQLKEMSDAGMDIQSHSSTHVDFSKATSERIATEVTSSKAILEGITGKPVNALAFPGCLGDTKSFEILGSSGYSTAYSCGKHIDIAYNNRFYISRVHVFDDMESFIKMISVGL